MSQETTEQVAPAIDATNATSATKASDATVATSASETTTTSNKVQASPCQSPPPAPTPAREQTPDPRARLLELAAQLMRSNNRRLVVEYLRLRRAVA